MDVIETNGAPGHDEGRSQMGDLEIVLKDPNITKNSY